MRVDAEKRLARLAALQETSRALVSTLNLDALLNLIIQKANALLQTDGGMLNLVDWKTREDEVVASTGLAAETLGMRVPLQHSLSGWAAIHNQPDISNRIANDSRVNPLAGQGIFKRPLRNAAVVPLSVKGEVIGTLVMVDKLGGVVDFDPSDLDLLMGFAGQAAAAIENARLYGRAQQAAVMEERSRLARELHDAVTQTLFSAGLIADALPSAWEHDPEHGRELLQDLRNLSRGALAEMRSLLLELRPAALEETRLEDLLRQLGEAAGGREGIPVQLVLEGEGVLPPAVRTAMYRIAQEALNNVVKHARAGRVLIQLCYSCNQQEDSAGLSGALLSIIDDGCGFDVEEAPQSRMGLGIMRERAGAVGADLLIESRPGEGTRVTVQWMQPLGGEHE